MKKVTAVFDIGKTNKKFFLFDEDYQEVHKEYQRFDEIEDEDGHPCDDLRSIQDWIRRVFRRTLNDERFDLRAINFSTYGASFVHIDKKGRPVAPLYNYLKPYPEDLLSFFYEKYGDKLRFAGETASPPLGMLNSGLQLYWLKYAKPEVFRKIRWSLHFPQYLSFLFTGIPVSEYTSIGCHTGLWDYANHDYHQWVYAEGIDHILPPIIDTATSINARYGQKMIKIGAGIHDSSSALLPYLKAGRKPFLLLSTGTWSIALNPFADGDLTRDDLQADCLNFMRVDGQVVRASRLFLGHEYKVQLERLLTYFGKDKGDQRTVKFDREIYRKLRLGPQQFNTSDLSAFDDFASAFHQLLIELVDLQIESAQRAIGKTAINKIYIDGGFADNPIYVALLAKHFSNVKMRITQSPLGSALGAAMVIADQAPGKRFLKKHYALKKYK